VLFWLSVVVFSVFIAFWFNYLGVASMGGVGVIYLRQLTGS